jgi:hypothetical protein
MKRDILSESIEPAVMPATYRGQELTVCEIAYDAVQNGMEVQLRWFCTSILGFPSTWTPYLAAALWKPNSSGELAWRAAEYPFAFLATATRRTVLRWNPVLIFGCDADKVDHPKERAVSTLRLGVPEESGWRDDPLGYLCYQYYGPQYVPDGREDETEGRWWLWRIADDLCLRPPVDGLFYNWDRIGYRTGLSQDEVSVMKARSKGYTRTTAERYLHWPEHKVQAVWRRLNRHLDDPLILDRLERVLVGEITEPPEINLWKTQETVSPLENWLYVANGRKETTERKEPRPCPTSDC